MADLLQALFLVTSVGILLGAGLPALFSVAIHFLSPQAAGGNVSGGRKAIGYLCLALVGVAVIAALLLIARERVEYATGWDPYPFLSEGGH